MNIRVSRVMKITVTADGETKEYDVAADTVEAALKKCGVKLGEEDRLNVAPTAKLTDGMAITVQRVTTQEVTETRPCPTTPSTSTATSCTRTRPRPAPPAWRGRGSHL